MIVIIYLQLSRTHAQCCTVFLVKTENLDCRRSFKCFLWQFHPNAPTKTPTPTDNLALTLQTKKDAFGRGVANKKTMVGFQPLLLSRGTCRWRSWGQCTDAMASEADVDISVGPWETLLRMDLILALRFSNELHGKIVITISVGALHWALHDSWSTVTLLWQDPRQNEDLDLSPPSGK